MLSLNYDDTKLHHIFLVQMNSVQNEGAGIFRCKTIIKQIIRLRI